jgi:hypothetical protein
LELFIFLVQKPTISEKDLSNCLRWMVLEGGLSIGFFSITTSGFLAAFALALGANNLQIGILQPQPFSGHTWDSEGRRFKSARPDH